MDGTATHANTCRSIEQSLSWLVIACCQSKGAARHPQAVSPASSATAMTGLDLQPQPGGDAADGLQPMRPVDAAIVQGTPDPATTLAPQAQPQSPSPGRKARAYRRALIQGTAGSLQLHQVQDAAQEGSAEAGGFLSMLQALGWTAEGASSSHDAGKGPGSHPLAAGLKRAPSRLMQPCQALNNKQVTVLSLQTLLTLGLKSNLLLDAAMTGVALQPRSVRCPDCRPHVGWQAACAQGGPEPGSRPRGLPVSEALAGWGGGVACLFKGSRLPELLRPAAGRTRRSLWPDASAPLTPVAVLHTRWSAAS